MTTVQEMRAAAAERSPRTVPAGAARLQPFGADLRVAELVDWQGEKRHQLDGIASTTNQPYEMYDFFGNYTERIDGHAFDATLAADPDVAFLLNHKGVTMARTRGKRSLELGVNSLGLTSRAYVNPERQDVRDMVIAIRDGDITEMSFAFMIEEGGWNDDYTEFTISKVNIDRGDVSAVNYGANPYTSIAARSSEILDALEHMSPGAARAALQRLQARKDIGARGDAERERQAVEPAPAAPAAPAAPPAVGRSIALIRAALLAEDDAL